MVLVVTPKSSGQRLDTQLISFKFNLGFSPGILLGYSVLQGFTCYVMSQALKLKTMELPEPV